MTGIGVIMSYVEGYIEEEDKEHCPYCGEEARMEEKLIEYDEDYVFKSYRCNNPDCKMSTWGMEFDLDGKPKKLKRFTFLRT